MKNIKEPIRLRQKQLKNGNVSLYLDLYINGKREYEFLKLYLIPEITKRDKGYNQQILQLANSIKAKRIIDIQNNLHGFNHRSNTAHQIYILQYFNKHTLGQIGQCLKRYGVTDHDTFAKIDKRFILGFRNYLQISKNKYLTSKTLAPNTQHLYFTKFKQVLKQAAKDGILCNEVISDIENLPKEPVQKNYLTIDEIQKIAALSSHEIVRKAFIFSCLTGLRYSDIKKLRWDEISKESKYTRITFKQKKTHRLEYLDITKQASDIIFSMDRTSEFVFNKLSQSTYVNVLVRKLVLEAKIDKKISFHCARHSFAVMMLTLNTDLYTVSKLLGHSNIRTTQIYAKVVDKKKQEAIDKIPQIF
jgi:integrase